MTKQTISELAASLGEDTFEEEDSMGLSQRLHSTIISESSQEIGK